MSSIVSFLEQVKLGYLRIGFHIMLRLNSKTQFSKYCVEHTARDAGRHSLQNTRTVKSLGTNGC